MLVAYSTLRNLTIYSTLRGFTSDRINVIQRNAVQSWRELDVEIIIMGDDPGVKEFCQELNLKQVSTPFNEHGTPYLRPMMQQAEEMAKNEFILLVAGDIVLFPETFQALKIDLPMFCVTSIKRESSLDGPIEFTEEWEAKVKNQIRHYSLPTSGDFFLYKKGFLKALPPMPDLLAGRSGSDCWLLYNSFQAGFLVDATESIQIIHQTHDHDHWVRVDGDSKEQPGNLELAGPAVGFTINQSNWILTEEYKLTKRQPMT